MITCQGHDRATLHSPCQSDATRVTPDGRMVCDWHYRDENGQILELQEIDLALANADPPVEALESPVQQSIRGVIEYATTLELPDDDDAVEEIDRTLERLRRLYFSFFLTDFGGMRDDQR